MPDMTQQLGGEEILTEIHSVARQALQAARGTRRTMRSRTNRTTRTRATRTSQRSTDRAAAAAVASRDRQLADRDSMLATQKATITDLTARWAATQALAEEATDRVADLAAQQREGQVSASAVEEAERDRDISKIHTEAWESRLGDAGVDITKLHEIAAEEPQPDLPGDSPHEIGGLDGLGEAAQLAVAYAEHYGSLDAHTFAASSVGVGELLAATHSEAGTDLEAAPESYFTAPTPEHSVDTEVTATPGAQL